MPTNQAAWLMAPQQPLQVKDAPYSEPQAGEVLVRNHAVAINPVDWMIPIIGNRIFPHLKFPLIIGGDCAGEVVAVGSGVTEPKVGDRVLVGAGGMCKTRTGAREGAFQLYTIALPWMTSVIPDSVSYEAASVVPLCGMTGACGLFQKDLLGLELPALNAPDRDQWVIIWGGATSVGCNAIQLAKGAGYKVVTTSSPKNFGFMRELGADLAFDYNSKSVKEDIVTALKGKDVTGALSIGAGSTLQCMDILSQCKGRKFVASCSSPVSLSSVKGDKPSLFQMLGLLLTMWRAGRATKRKTKETGVTEQFFDASVMIDNPETGVAKAVFRYFQDAMAAGKFRPEPPPRVVGNALADIQKAFAIQRAGVSAAKIVVSLP